MRERPVSQVPRWVLALLGGALGLQLWVAASRPNPHAAAADLGWPPSARMLQLASFGDPVPLAKLLMLYLQAFDYQAGTRVPYRDLDYDRLEAWLARIVALDPSGQYPLMSASRASFSPACAATTPLPATITGKRAFASMSPSRATAAASGRARVCAK